MTTSVLLSGLSMATGVSRCECPVCRRVLNGVTRANGKPVMPREGDLTVCLYCAAPLVFGLGLVLRCLKRGEVSGPIADDLERCISLVKAVR